MHARLSRRRHRSSQALEEAKAATEKLWAVEGKYRAAAAGRLGAALARSKGERQRAQAWRASPLRHRADRPGLGPVRAHPGRLSGHTSSSVYHSK
jgi:hypothetical protein